MPPVEFAFKPYRAPIPYVVILTLFPLIGFVMAGLLLQYAQAPAPWAFTGGGAFALGLAIYALYKDNRLQPAGALRLTAGRLVYTADAEGTLELRPEDVGDMLVVSGRLVVRQKYGRSLIIHVARMPVPLYQVQGALRSWMDSAGQNVGERFGEATDKAERLEARRQQVLRAAGGMRRTTDRLSWLLKLIGK